MDRRCTGHRKNGNPCNAPAIKGGWTCWRHTPNPQARANAAVRAEVQAWGLGDPDIDPGVTLLKLLAQAVARAEKYAAELEEHVAASDTLRDALVREAYGEFGPVGEYLRGLVVLEAQERDRAANFAQKAIAAGLAERQVRLAERQGALIADVLRAVLNDDELGLTAEQRRMAPGVARRHLSAVS